MTMKKVRKSDPRDGWYEVTPTEAQQMLDKRNKNRPLKERRAQRIAGEIGDGRYRENGETIVFNEAGKVLDGQHRLRACILANKPIVSYCVFGVADNVFPSFDQGQMRSGSDLAALMGFQYYAPVAAVARLAIRYADGTLATTGTQTAVSTEALRLYMKRNEDQLSESIEFVMKYRNGLCKLLPLSHVAFLHYMVAPKSNGKAT